MKLWLQGAKTVRSCSSLQLSKINSSNERMYWMEYICHLSWTSVHRVLLLVTRQQHRALSKKSCLVQKAGCSCLMPVWCGTAAVGEMSCACFWVTPAAHLLLVVLCQCFCTQQWVLVVLALICCDKNLALVSTEARHWQGRWWCTALLTNAHGDPGLSSVV